MVVPVRIEPNMVTYAHNPSRQDWSQLVLDLPGHRVRPRLKPKLKKIVIVSWKSYLTTPVVPLLGQTGSHGHL